MNPQCFSFFIPMIPKPKQSFRYSKGKNYTSGDVILAQRLIKTHIKLQLPKKWEIVESEVNIRNLTFIFPLPKSAKKANKNYVEEGV